MGKSLFPIHGKAQSQPNPTMFALQLPGEKLHPCAWPQTVWIWIVESFFWAPQKYQLIWLCTVDTWLNRKATQWILLHTQPVSGLNKKNKTNIPPKKTINIITIHYTNLYNATICNPSSSSRQTMLKVSWSSNVPTAVHESDVFGRGQSLSPVVVVVTVNINK